MSSRPSERASTWLARAGIPDSTAGVNARSASITGFRLSVAGQSPAPSARMTTDMNPGAARQLTLAGTVDPRHTCLAIHDMQNDFCTEGGKIYRRAAKHPELIAAAVREVATLADAARSHGTKVIYFQ